ncbi:MAG: glycoside hydrolase family 31 protein [Fusicatenibacter sp.]|nr:glycoside hydrolase family 31 protein [Lachnospiraceae bacterium]MDY2936749.1 glycoside hydrolase family 31 protein [Fusicatenibacter sp.]
MIQAVENKLLRQCNGEKLQIEPWGKNSLRIRVTKLAEFDSEDWALLPQPQIKPDINIKQKEPETDDRNMDEVKQILDDSAELVNGKIKVRITAAGKMIFLNEQDQVLLAEYEYDRHSSLKLQTRQLQGIGSGEFRASLKLAADENEKLFGMGQYQNGIFDLKGSFLELAQKNSQASIPFVYSTRGYGFFWNNPAIGRASFGRNMTEWEAGCTKQIDFWITAGDSPAEILSRYMEATGKPPMMPEHGLGFWQSKLRYQTQEELMTVAREYKRRGVPLDVIVADFFHWTVEGTWEFDPAYWPDPEAMVRELEEMGTRLMVSVWPTVSVDAPAYRLMRDRGYLVRTEKGLDLTMMMIDPTAFVDVTNPEAGEYLWSRIKENYVSMGITDFWLDMAEPAYTSYDFDNYRYYNGTAAQVGNIYPVKYTEIFYQGLLAEGVEPVNLVRCAWAGSQKYGALVWSGDIPSTFESFRRQIICGLQMAMSGIPWWTTDIGGFYDGDGRDPMFRELLVRWFQYGTFCPVMRIHGTRKPAKKAIAVTGGGRCESGAENEIWSFGEENYQIMKRYIEIRNHLRPYLRELMKNAHEFGEPVIRPLFYDFPKDTEVWDIQDQFMLGANILVAPVVEYGKRERRIYLPKGTVWEDAYSGTEYDGGQSCTCEAPLERIPVFIRVNGNSLRKCFTE